MWKLIGLYDRIVRGLNHLLAVIAGACVFVTAFTICYEIIMRGVFHSPTIWVMEISTYLVVAAGFLGMSYTMEKKSHIRVDFLTTRFSSKTQRILRIVTGIVTLFVLYVCMTEATNYVMMSREMGTVSPSLLRVPLWIPETFMIAGFTSLFLETIRGLLCDITGYERKEG